VLIQLGEVRQARERLGEAEALAERLNDDRRRGRVCAVMTNVHNNLGELDEALASGTRALEIGWRLGDLRLRIPATTCLEQAHYFRGEYERVVELATDNLAALPADWVYEYFGGTAPASVDDRRWLIISLAQLGRFAEAAEYEAEAIRLAQLTHHAFTVGLAHGAGSMLYLLKGDWAKARSLIEHGIAVLRSGERRPSAFHRRRLLRLGTGPARRSKRGAEPAPGRRGARRAYRGEGSLRRSGLGLPLAGSCLSATRPARRGAALGRPRGRILSAPQIETAIVRG
jgi:tetratricopeptide (TPR) repeat protein